MGKAKFSDEFKHCADAQISEPGCSIRRLLCRSLATQLQLQPRRLARF